MKINKKLLGSFVLGTSLVLAACGDDEQTAEKNDETAVEQENKVGNEKIFGENSIAEETVVPKGQTAKVQLIETIDNMEDGIITRTANQAFTILESMRGDEAVKFYKQYSHDEEYLEYALKENPEYEMAIVKLETMITDMKENGETITEMPLLDFSLVTFRSEKSGNDPRNVYFDLPVEMRTNPLQLYFEADKHYSGYLVGMVKKGEEFFVYYQAALHENLSSTTAKEPELNKNPITIFEVK